MASLFSGSARVTKASKLPQKASREQAIAMLHDHEFFLRCDPLLAKFEVVAQETATPQLPEEVHARAIGETISYNVTDVVHAIPAGIWDTNVVSTYEFTNMNNGVFVRIKSPMSIVMDNRWEIQGEDDALELVEDTAISCSRLLLGIMKSQCANGSVKMHAKMVERLEHEAKSATG
ncbi:hypothetical protein B0T19DRAFT_407341 [Cercophora scortea]|uniref:DUF7053 domain-containing protein n=1 Tax=Cercophora scortea TaxID=314031 RepID=A0AAE0MLS9_9PEZI|nr:hypothetical protein B0T19DRAFT_407341 [Cercophora scortea]